MDMYRDIGIYREINGYRGIYLFWDKFNKIFHGHKNHLISPVIQKMGMQMLLMQNIWRKLGKKQISS